MKQYRYMCSALCAILMLSAATACSDDENDYQLIDHSGGTNAQNRNRNDVAQNAVTGRLEFPKVKNDGRSMVVVHTATLDPGTGERGVNYCLEWDTAIRAQRWCCYQMYATVMQQHTSRYNGERTGGQITPQSAYPNDEFLAPEYQFGTDPFWSSGYDHGHICPSADRLCSAEANRQTFFLTNMMPQVNAFNAGIWEKMESQVRTWAKQCDTLYVCKGGTIDSEANIIKYLGSGQDRIPVPRYFFMALLAKNSMGYKAIGLWIEHRADHNKDGLLSQYTVNVRQLEQLTGIDFFCNLPDDVEEQVETLAVDNVKAAWGLK